jgi:glycosyltransferase involved in cell wall biosynthesis
MSSRSGHRTLTLAMIAKNESERLPECLASVKPIVDEIVVLDTGSTDDTVEVARSLGARTFRHDWSDDFSAARNESLRHATGDWILMLDADEIIAEPDLPRVRAFVDADEFDAVQLILANYCDECESMWWTPVEGTCALSRGFSGYIRVPLVRMWRNRPEYRFRGCVHETIVASIREAGGTIAQTDILIHHYGKDARTAEKSELYLRLGERNVAEQPDDPKAQADLATQFKELGRWEEAEHYYRRALSLDPDSLVAQSGLVQVFAQTGRLAEAERILKRIELQKAAPSHVAVNLAIILMRRGHLASAKEKLEAAVVHNPDDVVAHIYLGKVDERCAETSCAEAAYRRAVELCPAYGPAVAALRAFECREQAGKLVGVGDGLGALKLLKDAAEHDAADAMTYLALGSVLDSLDRTEAAYRMVLRAAESEPFLPVVRETLEGLARRLGRMDEAARVLAAEEDDGN